MGKRNLFIFFGLIDQLNVTLRIGFSNTPHKKHGCVIEQNIVILQNLFIIKKY